MRWGSLRCECGLGAHTAELPGGLGPRLSWGHMVGRGLPGAAAPGGLMDVQLTCLWLCWQLSWNRKLVL